MSFYLFLLICLWLLFFRALRPLNTITKIIDIITKKEVDEIYISDRERWRRRVSEKERYTQKPSFFHE